MRVALASTEATIDIAQNKQRILAVIDESLGSNPDLIVFGETAITGYQDRGDPEDVDFDRGLCEEVGGAFLTEVAGLARQHSLMISIGFFEGDEERIHDSSVVFGPTGGIIHHYRRVDRHWRNRSVDPAIYVCGESVPLTSTPHGSFSTMICGDLFNDEVLNLVRTNAPDFLLYPLAATPDHGKDWENAVRTYYADRLRPLETYTLMVNLYESGPGWEDGEGSRVGGACVINPAADVVAEHPSGSPGILICELPSPSVI